MNRGKLLCLTSLCVASVFGIQLVRADVGAANGGGSGGNERLIANLTIQLRKINSQLGVAQAKLEEISTLITQDGRRALEMQGELETANDLTGMMRELSIMMDGLDDLEQALENVKTNVNALDDLFSAIRRMALNINDQSFQTLLSTTHTHLLLVQSLISKDATGITNLRNGLENLMNHIRQQVEGGGITVSAP